MNLRRRQVLRCGIGVFTGSVLSGCTGLPTDDSGAESTDTTTSSLTATATPSPETSESESSAEESLEALQWTYDVGGTITRPPLAVDGAVYGATGTTTTTTGEAEATNYEAFAVDASDGSERWTFDLDAPVTTTPIYDDGTVYVLGGWSTGTSGEGYRLWAVDEKGTVEWQYRPEDAEFVTVVAVADETILLGDYDDAPGSTSGSHVYAVDRTTGEERWTIEMGDVGGGIVLDETALVRSDSGLYALALETGEERWRHANNDLTGVPFTDGERLYAMVSGAIVELDLSDGTERWRYDMVGPYRRAVTTNGTIVLTLADGPVVGLDPSDGPEIWRFTDTGTGSRLVDVTPETVHCTTFHGEDGAETQVVHSLDAADGTERWRVDVGEGRGHVTVADQTLLVWRADPWSFAAVSVPDGTERWRFEPDAPITRPAFADGTALVGTENGTLYALDYSLE